MPFSSPRIEASSSDIQTRSEVADSMTKKNDQEELIFLHLNQISLLDEKFLMLTLVNISFLQSWKHLALCTTGFASND